MFADYPWRFVRKLLCFRQINFLQSISKEDSVRSGWVRLNATLLLYVMSKYLWTNVSTAFKIWILTAHYKCNRSILAVLKIAFIQTQNIVVFIKPSLFDKYYSIFQTKFERNNPIRNAWSLFNPKSIRERLSEHLNPIFKITFKYFTLMYNKNRLRTFLFFSF